MPSSLGIGDAHVATFAEHIDSSEHITGDVDDDYSRGAGDLSSVHDRD